MASAELLPASNLPLSTESSVLLLGTGFVAEPCVQFLSRDPLIRLTVASNEAAKLHFLECKYSCKIALLLLPEERDKLSDLVSKYDVTISLLPTFLHLIVAEAVVQQKRHLVTASYVSEGIRKLHSVARESNVILLNEMGLDPGIDHMLALREIREVQRGGGRVRSYTSWCGGLPAPKSADNPLRYKFTWAPIGMLTNVWNPFKYLENGQVIAGEGGTGWQHLRDIRVSDQLSLEAFPNRDSLPYVEAYGIPGASTVIRGSLRYPGHTRVLNALKDLKLIDRSPLQHPSPGTWSSYLLRVLGRGQEERERLEEIVGERLGDPSLAGAMEELGLLSDVPIEVLPSPVETLARFLEQKFPLKREERDLVVIVNTIEADYGEGQRVRVTASLSEFGTPNGFSAMSRCVGITAGIGC